jgi:hypothetical protein
MNSSEWDKFRKQQAAEREQLQFSQYLRFRHVFRNAFSFDLDWQKMSPLVLRLEETFKKLENAFDDFLK